MNIKNEIENIRDMIYKVYYQGGILASIMLEENEASPQFCGEMDKLVCSLEDTAIRARCLNETCYMDVQPLEKSTIDYERHWAKSTSSGKVEVDENGWLNITLNTLLAHCKQWDNLLMKDTLVRLLRGYSQSGKKLPYFERAMLIIDEHCDIENRRVYDQDNKAWKAIPNVLKGLVIPDDDQFSLGIALVSTQDSIPACHIRVMDIADAGTYFSLYYADSGSYFLR